MERNWFEEKSHVYLVFLLVVIAYFLLMFGNGIVSLTHPDEVFYIQSAKEMLARNSWLTPIIFDDIHFEKPFLPFVLFMVAIKISGPTPFAARFWPALFGIIGVVTVYWIAWTLFNRKRLAFFSGIILSSSFIYMALARAVLTDMIFAVFVAIAIGCFCWAYHNRKYKSRGIILFFVVSAIAVMTKGLLGMLFPVTTAIVFLVYKKELDFFKCRATLWGLFLFVGITAPWHLIMYLRYGADFTHEYFYNVHWHRVLAAEHKKLDNWYFYLMMMVAGVMPWSLFWVPAIRSIFRQFKKKLASRDKLFFLLAWIASVYIFVQPAHSKLASYIFPAFPAIAIILGYALHRAVKKAANGQEPYIVKFCSYVMAMLLIVIAFVGTIIAKRYPAVITDMRPIYGGAAAYTVVALLITFFNVKKKYISMFLTYLSVSIVLLGCAYFCRSFIEPWVSCKPICDVFNELETGQGPVLSSKFYVRGVRYYTDRPMAVIDINGKGFWSSHPIEYLDTDPDVWIFLEKYPVTWAILKEGNIRDLERILKQLPFDVQQIEGIGGKYILRIEQRKK